MPIHLTCICGKKMTVPDAHAGKKGKCSSCNAILSVPSIPSIDTDSDDDEELLTSLKRAPHPPNPPAPQSVPQLPAQASPSIQKVSLVDLDLPFLSMVRFLVKWSLASIPAFIILFLIFLVFWKGQALLRDAIFDNR